MSVRIGGAVMRRRTFKGFTFGCIVGICIFSSCVFIQSLPLKFSCTTSVFTIFDELKKHKEGVVIAVVEKTKRRLEKINIVVCSGVKYRAIFFNFSWYSNN